LVIGKRSMCRRISVNTYRKVVMSVQMKAKYSIVEMTREATPVEIDQCKMVYCGFGYWKEEHVQENISKYI
jgi:hypothetical protein